MINNKELQKIAHLRREYARGGLRRKDLPDDPADLFDLWLQQVVDSGLPEANAMSLATVDSSGQPFQRIVLLKHCDQRGMVFYTNLGSRKAQHLSHNPRVSLLFPWHMLERQVLVLGEVQSLPVPEVMNYFHSRPRDSQIGAWASRQSSRILSRSVIEGNFLEFKKKFQSNEVPLPGFWGGFRVVINTYEFWQGGEHRLHDRFFYQRTSAGWQIDRLAP